MDQGPTFLTNTGVRLFMTTVEKKQILMGVLTSYKRWNADGRKKYGYGNGEQMYHDTYHDCITPVAGSLDCYSFYIQIYDSPTRDTWWQGEFKALNGDTDVEILQESYRRT